MRVLILGYKSIVDQAIDKLDFDRTTVTEMRKYPRVSRRASEHARMLPCGTPSDVEAVLAALARAGEDPAGFDVVWGIDEFTVVPAAVVAAAIGRPAHLPLDVSLRFRDKELQKRAVRAAGLPTARTAVATRFEDLAAEPARGLGWPRVVKPMAGAAAADTHRVDTAEELQARIGLLLESAAAQGPFLVEEYVEGRELHLDGCVRDGRLTAFGVSRYLQNCLDIRDGGVTGSYTLDAGRHPELCVEAGRFALRCLQALGMRDGIFHMEVFEGPDGLVFSECAARAGGGMITEGFEARYGVNLLTEQGRAVAGLPAGEPVPGDRVYGQLSVRPPAGTALAVPDTEELLQRPGVVDGRVEIVAGKPLPAMANTAQRGGIALLAAPDEDTVAARMRELQEWFLDAVVVEQDA
ncbi:acetyl-CoA carboxylase biotin carboxylase subunit family protein [Streptomyces luteogriseus]|uniref:ATP-grasp domain-containing protein n=1 Tax=Streptomyces luteogriseus TaxID=68233 RepID=UPI0037FE48A1